jgi:glycerate kinase
MNSEIQKPRVVVCLDKFRGSLSADQACHAVAKGIREGTSPDDANVVSIPVADGGEGTIDALVHAGYERIRVAAHDPAGKAIDADFAVKGNRAVVELAQASGLHLISGRPIPLTASTFGTGEVIQAALDQGCTEIVLAVGGCAATDGGSGMLQALGARLTGADGRPIGPGGQGLSELQGIELGGLDNRLAHTDFILASDVTNPLLGISGAAAVYGPQKGANTQDIITLETGLRHLASLMNRVTGQDLSVTPGAGASGGTGFAALSALRAVPQPGIEFVLDQLRVAEVLKRARLVIVGEGRLDEQTLDGKAPVGVAKLAHRAGVPLIAIAGQISLNAEQLHALGIMAAYSVLEEAGNIDSSISECAYYLQKIGHRIADNYLKLSRSRICPFAGLQ